MIDPSQLPPAQRRISVTLFATQSLFSAATIATFPLLPILAARLASASMAGVPSTVLLFGRASMAYPVGWVMDRYGRRAGLALGFGLAICGLLLSALAIPRGSFLLFCVGAALVGMGRAASEQARYIAAEVFLPARRAKVMGLIVMAGTVGAVGGPLLTDPSGQLAARLGFLYDTGPYLFGAVLMVGALLLTLFFLWPDPLQLSRQITPPRPETETQISGQTKTETGRPLGQIFRSGPVQLAVAAMIVGQLVMTLLMVITPLHMSNHEHTTRTISWVIMAHTLGMFGLAPVTGWLIDRLGSIPMILAGALVLVLSALLTPLSTAFVPLAVALFLLGLGWNFCFIAGSNLLSDSLQAEERGRVQGANEMMVALASGMGSLSTGATFAMGGILAVSAVGLAFGLALVAGVAWRGRRPASVVVGSGD